MFTMFTEGIDQERNSYFRKTSIQSDLFLQPEESPPGGRQIELKFWHTSTVSLHLEKGVTARWLTQTNEF